MNKRLTLSLSLLVCGALAADLALAQGSASDPNAQLAAGFSVGGTDVGGLNRADALQKLQAALPPAQNVSVLAGSQHWNVSADALGRKVDLGASLDAAFAATAQQNMFDKLRSLVGAAAKQDFPLVKTVDTGAAKSALTQLVTPLLKPAVNAKIVFSKTRYAVTPDVSGTGASVDAAVQALGANPDATSLTLTISSVPASVTAASLAPVVAQGNRLMRTVKVSLAGKPGVSLITPLQMANLYWVRPTGIELDNSAIAITVKRLAGELDHPAKNARYDIKGQTLSKVAGYNGLVVDQTAAVKALTALVNPPASVPSTGTADSGAPLQTSLTLVGKVSTPQVTTDQLPDPGALSLIATGHSTYYGSHPERMTNIAVAQSKLNGVVIPADATFSFLNTIGHITDDNGFVGGLIISGGRTVEGLGGGVCQVSTTTFRALYSAGMPVVERHQHAYRVGYYEPQVGFEAAVYDPGLDLKMKNDTGGPVLLRTVNNPARRSLDIQVWGLKQSRKVSVSSATILSHTPHPPAQTVVNANLRPGQRNQVDWAVDGYKLYITRTIKYPNGGVKTDQTSTDYKPWRAVFEVGPSSQPASKQVKPATPPNT